MTIPTFIEKAIEGGWVCKVCVEPEKNYHWYLHAIVLDPEAWKAVGKVEGWGDEAFYDEKQAIMTVRRTWLKNMHRMIDALAGGKTIEQYLETL